METKILSVENLSKEYLDNGHKIVVIENISFHLNENEFLTLLGSKNSGKSTILRIIAGLENSTTVSVNLYSSQIGYIPASPSSLPWLNVKQNIEYYIKAAGKTLNNDDIQALIDVVGLSGYEEHFPDNRSKGFRFRISLASALALSPNIILIDEPFNNLDKITKQEMFILLREVKNKKKLSILFSTSNISESIFLSDRILIIQNTPGQLTSAINIDLPAERKLDIFSSQLFFDLLEKIESEIKPDGNKTLNSFQI